MVWQSSKQPNVALNTAEAEYAGGSECCRCIVSKRGLLGGLGVKQSEPTPLFIDNETAIRMAIEGGNSDRRKHINIKHHFMRELVSEQTIQLMWVPTQQQQADIMTKPLGRNVFEAQRNAVMGHA